jgi:hypothetical protein
MQTQQHPVEWPDSHGRNMRINQKIPRIQGKWKYNPSEPVGHSKSPY